MMRGFATLLLIMMTMTSCVTYHSPARQTWPTLLRGASMTDMTEMSRVAKRPVYLGAGGQLVTATENPAADKIANENAAALNYMAKLEYALYDALRMPGISVQRAGTDVVVIMVRDALMELDVADISPDGDRALNIMAKILRQYDATFIEIAGYTDAMRDGAAARSLSLDMAQRVAVYLAQHKINTARMFIVGRGATRPIAAQDDIGRLTNRRVEIRLAPAR